MAACSAAREFLLQWPIVPAPQTASLDCPLGHDLFDQQHGSDAEHRELPCQGVVD